MEQSKRSAACSKAHNGMAARGQHTTDDSTGSERKLIQAAKRVIDRLRSEGRAVTFATRIPYWPIKERYSKLTGFPGPTDEDKRCSIKPDGGVITVDGVIAGIFEDKFEGTADLEANKAKGWKCGSTIDRTAKNLNALKMYCAGTGLFPYVVFAHGCNFHPVLTMYKRLEQLNNAFPPEMIVVRPETNYDQEFQQILDRITPETVGLRGPLKLEVANIIIKTHAARGPEAMGHGSSDFTVDEYERIIEATVRASLAKNASCLA
jgi:hypothetical protein